MAEGERQFTRIFIRPTSCARWRVSIITPAFAAAYAGDAGDADRPAVDAIVTIAPARRSFMPGRKAFRVKKVAVRLWSMPDRQSSSVVCSTGAGIAFPPPAKASKISTGPNFSSVASRARSIASESVQSAAIEMVWTSKRFRSSSTRPSVSRLRPLTATLTPLAASQRQVSAPIPPDPPVTKAVFPLRSG
jgi:hypothetical protein